MQNGFLNGLSPTNDQLTSQRMLNFFDNVTEYSLGNKHGMMIKNGKAWNWGDNSVIKLYIIF
jgi:hypothetical protein